jgi:D-glycero-D-manno-heptose 1,7-bisphosphate phosphatase
MIGGPLALENSLHFREQGGKISGTALFLGKNKEHSRFLAGQGLNGKTVEAGGAGLFFDGWLLVVITNQSGIARGYYTEADYQQLTTHLHETLRACGVVLDAVLHCPHLPDAQLPAYRRDCDCRKPGPGMLLQAADRLAIDLGSSALVGDRHTDLLAGRAAGVDRCILVRSGHPPDAPALAEADAVHDDLAEWVATLTASGAAPADTA